MTGNYYQHEPYKELAYSIVERALLDATGKVSYLQGKMKEGKRLHKERIMFEARRWIRERGGDFDYYCGALNINANDKRARLGIERR